MRLQKRFIYPLFFILFISYGCFADEPNTSTSEEQPSTLTSEEQPDNKMLINNKPITIDANNQQIDIDKNIITFSGKVQITQDGLTILADKVIVTDMQDSTKQKITAYGNPVNFKQILPQNNKVVTGHSGQVIYDVKKNTVTLLNNAELFQQDNHVVSSIITYNVKKQLIIAQPKKGRVKSTIIASQVKEINK